MRMTSGILVFLAVAAIQVQAQKAKSPTTAPPLRTNSVDNFAVESFLNTGTSGSIIVTGPCKKGPYGDGVLTDLVSIPDPAGFKRIDETLDNLSGVSDHYAWTRQNDGLVQLKDNRATAPLLRLELQRVELTKVVNLEDAIDKLLAATEVKAFLDRNHIALEPVFDGGSMWNEKMTRQLSKSRTAPKYSLTLTKVTVEEALNSAVRTFPGVWVYYECPGQINLISRGGFSPSSKK